MYILDRWGRCGRWFLLSLFVLFAACSGARRHGESPASPSPMSEPPMYADEVEAYDDDRARASDESDEALEITAVPSEPPPAEGIAGGEVEEVGTEERRMPPDTPANVSLSLEEDEEEALEIVAQISAGPPPEADEGERAGSTAALPAPPPPASGPVESSTEPEPAPEFEEGASPPRARVRARRRRRRARVRNRRRDRRPPSAAVAPAQPAPAVRYGPTGGATAAPSAPPVDRSAPAANHGAPVSRIAVDGDVGGRYSVHVESQNQQVTTLLTAATVPDVDRRFEYLTYLARHPSERALLRLDMSRRVRFRVVDGHGRPVHDANLTLIGGGGRVEGRTHADGWWDFFPSVGAPQMSGPTTIYVQTGNVTAQATVPIPAAGDGRDIIVRLPQAAAVGPAVLDLAFLIDVTGSMGDELRYVNEEVVGIVTRVRAAVPQVRVRVAATFYRDRGDYAPIQQIPFSEDVRAFESHMRLVDASGGGDYPEDVNTGLAAALTTLQWSGSRAVRVLVLIADAPPQHYPDFAYTYHHAMADASRRGIRFLPVAASGSDRVVEYLFRALGAYTSTPYVYLTDDSGVGGSHMEADTDRIAIEMFSDLLTRLLIADLRGEGMHEPEAIREAVFVPAP